MVPSALVATAPATAVAPCLTTKVVALSGSIAISNVADSFALTGTPTAASSGEVEIRLGAGAGVWDELPPQPAAAREIRMKAERRLCADW